MPTDDELTMLLRRGFAQATADLDPNPDLACVIHRRHAGARRRRVAVAVAVPAAALAAGAGFALAGPGTPNRTAQVVAPPSAPAPSGSAPRTTPHTSVPIKVASYRVDRQVVRRHHSAPLNCPANATAPRSASRRTRGRVPGSGRTEGASSSRSGGRTPSPRTPPRSTSRATPASTERSKTGCAPSTPRASVGTVGGC